ncbi:kinase-like domain-containing protein [Cantharellus anzutake]|uniref:kinase-like domain-containing protein n=1 Tax=Cantharellus anzutake TaxID=1750568 RepID=UPI0019070D97|nr:kinase-like domain-containing protein [Cantharellus anzutake]KAF8331751.1 kinase-like domain-containing protein [Cantharellus anzutake]
MRLKRGFGDVYLGEYHNSNVCVKVLKEVPVISTDWLGKFIRRLRREVKVWHNLQHGNIVAFLGWTLQRVVDDKLRVSLISEWAEGGNVKDFLRRNPLGDRPHLITCQGLVYAENILVLGADCDAQLCDFGLSSILDDFTTHAESSSVMSTPRYASPELVEAIITGRNEASDIWAFGCTAAELPSAISKGPPYEWSNVGSVERCLSACFEPRPELRPSAAELNHLLERVQRGETLTSLPIGELRISGSMSTTGGRVAFQSPFITRQNRAAWPPETLESSLPGASKEREQKEEPMGGTNIGIGPYPTTDDIQRPASPTQLSILAYIGVSHASTPDPSTTANPTISTISPSGSAPRSLAEQPPFIRYFHNDPDFVGIATEMSVAGQIGNFVNYLARNGVREERQGRKRKRSPLLDAGGPVLSRKRR